MTNAPTPNSPSSPSFHSNPASSSGLPRSSYASVAAGIAASQHLPLPPSQTVSLADIMNPHQGPSTQVSTSFLEQRAITRSSRPQTWRKSASYNPTYPQIPLLGRMRQDLAWDQGLCLPSYLRDSRYGVQLRDQQVRRAKQHAERPSAYLAKKSSSANSSSASLPRLQPSKRGMTHDVVETEEPSTEVPLLPSRWSEKKKNEDLELHSDGLEVKYAVPSGSGHDAPAIRTDQCIPPACGVYYYEVSIASKGREG